MSATAEYRASDQPSALRDLPPFPPVAARLMRVISKEDFAYREVAELVRTDPAFTAEVLRLANSPVFGFRHAIKDVPHAIAVLGVNRLRGIVMTLAMKDLMLSAGQHDTLKRCWRHSLACALACEVLAPAHWVDSGLGYTAGLLHDVGALALVASHAEAYEQLLALAGQDADSLLAGERELLGVDHCEAGRWLLEEWGLPEEFQEAAAGHHGEAAGALSEVTRLARLCCETASMAGFPFCVPGGPWQPEAVLDALPPSLGDRFRPRIEELPMEIATKINSFDCDFMPV